MHFIHLMHLLHMHVLVTIYLNVTTMAFHPIIGVGKGDGAAFNLHGGYGQSGNIDGHSNSEAGGNGGDSYWGGGGRGATHWGNRAPGKYGGGVSNYAVCLDSVHHLFSL